MYGCSLRADGISLNFRAGSLRLKAHKRLNIKEFGHKCHKNIIIKYFNCFNIAIFWIQTLILPDKIANLFTVKIYKL